MILNKFSPLYSLTTYFSTSVSLLLSFPSGHFCFIIWYAVLIYPTKPQVLLFSLQDWNTQTLLGETYESQSSHLCNILFQNNFQTCVIFTFP